MLSSKTFISLILGTVAYQGAADDLRDACKIAPAATAKKPWGWVFAAFLMLAIHAPGRADNPCTGEDNRVARPIAAILQPNASAFDKNGRFEVTIQSNADLTTDIYLRHAVGSKELFRAITRLQSEIHTVVVGRLPTSEGLGFSIEVEEGGSGYRQFCMYGFRFQQDGVVSYRTLAARAETRGGGIFAGEVTDWKSVLVQTQPASISGKVNPAASSASASNPAALSVSQALTSADVTRLNASIDKRLRHLSQAPPPYLFAAVTFFDNVNAAIIGNNVARQRYDAYYFASLDYRHLAVKRLIKAREFVRASKRDVAEKSITESDRYARMMFTSYDASLDAFNDNVDAAESKARVIHELSKIAAVCGSAPLGPAVTKTFEAAFDLADFGVDWIDAGLAEATKRTVVNQTRAALLSHMGVANPCNNLLASDALSFNLFGRLEATAKSPEFRRSLGGIVAASIASTVKGDVSPLVDLVVMRMTGQAAAPLRQLEPSDLILAEDAYRFAKLSEHIYTAQSGGSLSIQGRTGMEKWTILDLKEAPPKLKGFYQGFKAAVYLNERASQCAVVFAGTNVTDIVDWANNFAQGIGIAPPEYRDGAAYAVKATQMERCQGKEFVLTGHSLGGGIAQYAYLKTGKPYKTYTFNPAGLAPTNLDYQVANLKTDHVVNFIAEVHDPPSGIQIGRDTVSLSGVTLGSEILIPVYSWSTVSHFVPVLVEGMGIQRDYCYSTGACRLDAVGKGSNGASVPGEFPLMPFIDYDYQVDLVTGDWHLRRVHALFADIGDNPRSIGTLKAGETVIADQIAIRTFTYEIYEVNEPTVGKFWNHVTQQGILKIIDTQVALRKGDRIVVLSYFGEGECRVWFKGKTYVAECPTITGAVDNQLPKRKSEIWARVVTNKGQRGYLRDPDALGMSKHD